MIGFKALWSRSLLGLSVLALFSFSSALAQTDPDPNSPFPELIAEKDITRVLAVDAGGKHSGLPDSGKSEFRLGDDVKIFVANVDLMQGEGAKAFRAYAKDSRGRLYRFPVRALHQVKSEKPLYALTVTLKDEIGFWEQPLENGDLQLIVTWRGLATNPLLIGLGTTGGLKLEPAEYPTSRKHDTTSEYVGYTWSGDRKRFLEQATFGPTAALDHRIRRIGIRAWLAEQWNAPYPHPSNPYPNLALLPNNVETGCPFPRGTLEYNQCVRNNYTPYLNQNWFYKEAFYGDAQLRHRVAWALSQLWVTSYPTIRQSSHIFAYHQILAQHSFGNYRDLMKDMTLSPAMGEYLDMARSTKNNPNENYAREILQLFTIGLFMLNQDGTLQLDGNNEPIPTYNQETVNQFTKVLTGWTFCNSGCPNSTLGAVNFKDPLVLNQNNHNVQAKTLLDYPNAVNRDIPSGMNGNAEMDLALDNIFYHPNLGPFVGKFLIQHLVTSDPTPAYVGRVAAAFNNNGQGVRGDLKAVVKAILLDPEARGDLKTDPNFGKLREPVQLVSNFYRHFDVQSADGTTQSDGYVTFISEFVGQAPYEAPTVFNFYPPNYMVPGTSLLAPEFGLLNTGSAIGRVDVATFMSFVPVNVDNRTPPNAPLGTSINVDDLIQIAQDDPTGNALIDALDRKMMHNTMSAEMKSTILTGVLAVPASEPEFRVRTALFLVTSSSQYQIQR